jgi:hypothetical protein
MTCATSFRNAIVAAALIALAHGLLLRNEEARLARLFAPAVSPMASGWPGVGVRPAARAAIGHAAAGDALSEMFAFASQDAQWGACDQVPGGDDLVSPPGGRVLATCTPRDAPATPYAVVNTYEAENVMNGGEGDEGLRGFDPLEGGLTGSMLD